VSSSLTVRPARVKDVAQMARVNVRCWQEWHGRFGGEPALRRGGRRSANVTAGPCVSVFKIVRASGKDQVSGQLDGLRRSLSGI
jgi:hypothetical protein